MLEALAQIVANKISETYRREAEIEGPEKVYQVDRDTVSAVLTHLRDNVTPEMVKAGGKVPIHAFPSSTEMGAIFTAMINKAMEA